MRRLPVAAALMAAASLSFAAQSSPKAPAEVIAAAPAGATLLAFSASGDAPDADAAAVFETSPDKDGVTHRTLTVFGKKDGRFVADFSSDKLIACSKCSQFHTDPFRPRHLKVAPGHVHIDQFDSGEKPSTMTLDLTRQAGAWHVTGATRETVVAGREKDTTETLPLPPSGLAKDMDAKWRVPVFLNTLLVDHKNGKFAFLHGDVSNEAMWKNQKSDCSKEDCTVLVQQQDGCISLVRDESSRSFGGASPNPDDEKEAVTQAINACVAAGGKVCKEVRTDCSKGIL
ncbi:DUF4189 domain-containing protein [Frateuria defendens]|uniref:DUF4189 domain-containing protein n=1 Tax=Frateuria defendens TaxID=2219559 RepID=UPI00137914C3|nr:DUF4189 domain-containing protein [Frateuria defendens]